MCYPSTKLQCFLPWCREVDKVSGILLQVQLSPQRILPLARHDGSALPFAKMSASAQKHFTLKTTNRGKPQNKDHLQTNKLLTL